MTNGKDKRTSDASYQDPKRATIPLEKDHCGTYKPQRINSSIQIALFCIASSAFGAAIAAPIAFYFGRLSGTHSDNSPTKNTAEPIVGAQQTLDAPYSSRPTTAATPLASSIIGTITGDFKKGFTIPFTVPVDRSFIADTSQFICLATLGDRPRFSTIFTMGADGVSKEGVPNIPSTDWHTNIVPLTFTVPKADNKQEITTYYAGCGYSFTTEQQNEEIAQEYRTLLPEYVKKQQAARGQ